MLLLLPEVLSLSLFDYLDADGKNECSHLCKEWFELWLKKLIRKMRLRMWDYNDYDPNVILAIINQSIRSPFNQLSLSCLSIKVPNSLIPVVSGLDYCFHELECSEIAFLEIMTRTEKLRVKHLLIDHHLKDSIESNQKVLDSFRKISDCQNLTLQFGNTTEFHNTPYLPFVQSLTIHEAYFTHRPNPLANYANTLQRLSLTHCIISDVTMLGSIPYLELSHCFQLRDISALNNNDHVVIENCFLVKDFSRCFANSRKIKIHLVEDSFSDLNEDEEDNVPSSQYLFDLTRWAKVEDLTLKAPADGLEIDHYSQLILPISVRRCNLEGIFVSLVDFRLTSEHELRELKLSNDYNIDSLERYGLERVGIVELDRMHSLQTLQGLGRGKNRKMALSRCHAITDLSPLNGFRVVQLSYCNGFTSLRQVQSVEYLTIVSNNTFSLESDVIPRSLTLLDTLYVKEFHGLEQIPFLQLNDRGYELLKLFLEQGGRLLNQRIVLKTTGRLKNGSIKLLELHNQFLEKDYDYFDNLPKRWVWARK